MISSQSLPNIYLYYQLRPPLCLISSESPTHTQPQDKKVLRFWGYFEEVVDPSIVGSAPLDSAARKVRAPCLLSPSSANLQGIVHALANAKSLIVFRSAPPPEHPRARVLGALLPGGRHHPGGGEAAGQQRHDAG